MKKGGLLDTISSTLPLLGGSALVLSISYDFFFLNAIGLNFIVVPTTLSDHVRSSIIWIPVALATLIMIFVVSALTSPVSTVRIFFRKKEVSGNQQLEEQQTTRSKFDVFQLLVIWMVFLGTLLFDPSGGFITATMLIIFTLSWAIKGRKKDQILLRLTIFAIVLAGCLGHFSGTMFMTPPTVWHVQYASSDEHQPSGVRGIRRFSDFSIIYDDSRFAIVISYSEIKSVRRIEKTVLRESYSCLLINFMCKPDKAEGVDDSKTPLPSSSAR